ncbi:MAG TPA: DUF3800 domain-containing protein, partial [Longimicrobium sp.]|nr:DUF3800 domain-containing protein [Longimicrobium sp.]
KHRARYAQPSNPYHIAMSFGLERLHRHLQAQGCRGGTTPLLFERRGGKEDAELEAAFRRLCESRTTPGGPLPFQMVLTAKTCNSAGLQLADLVARPIGRKVIKPEQENRAYDILRRKFRRSPTGRVLGWGLKIFPS